MKLEMQNKWLSNLEVLICTRADKGSVAYDGKNFYFYGIEKCVVVDTIGAGDSYIAGFIVDYLKNNDYECYTTVTTVHKGHQFSYTVTYPENDLYDRILECDPFTYR